MGNRTKMPKRDYAVDLFHSGTSITFTNAQSSRKAVANVISRRFPNQISEKMRQLDDLEGVSCYAFPIPEIVAEDERPISQDCYELAQEGVMASRIAGKLGGSENDHLLYARHILKAYRAHRIEQQ